MRKAWILALAVLAFGGCTLPRGAAIDREVLKEADSSQTTFSVVPVTRASLSEISKWPVTGWSGGYRWISGGGGPGSAYIKPGDVISLVIWDSQDTSLLTGPGQPATELPNIQVSPSGTIFIPYVGEVRVNGMTQSQARLEVQDALGTISQSVQVQLQVAAGQANTVDMVGGVAQPGSVALQNRKVTLLSLIAHAGGVSASLKNPLVRLVRSGHTYEIRGDDLFSNARRNITMRGGDKVIIEEDNRYFVALGATGTEELVYFDREQITTLEALSMVGGLQDSRANLQGILILREYPEGATSPPREHGPDMQQVIFTFDLTTADGLFAARKFRVNPNDTVIATESPIGPASTVLSLVTGLVNVGTKL